MLADAEKQGDDGSRDAFRDTVFDVCIVGAGPAGITLARALAAKGHRVALMEAGGLEPSPASEDPYKGANVGLPYPPLEACRLRFLGGTSNHWGGYTRPLDARDFEPLTASPLNAWPIRRADLDPYAEAAATILDLPPAAPLAGMFAGKDDLIWPSVYRVSPVHFAAKYKDELAASERITLTLNANLVDIALEDGLGAVAALTFRAYSRDEPFTVRARQYAICCGGIENARILLNANRQLPQGIGNAADLVGRHFCEHLEIPVGQAILATPITDLDFYIASDQIIAERRCLPFELELVPLERDDPSCALPFAKRVASALSYPGAACFDAILQVVLGQVPNPASRVTLAAEKDRFGLPRVALDWQLADIDGETLKIGAEEMGRAMARHDVGRLQIDPWALDAGADVPLTPDVNGSCHHMCTTRMSDDAKAGVVNRDCRVHGVDNLYLGGSSVFASPGVSNPTLTIVQLALRLADHLDARLGKG